MSLDTDWTYVLTVHGILLFCCVLIILRKPEPIAETVPIPSPVETYVFQEQSIGLWYQDSDIEPLAYNVIFHNKPTAYVVTSENPNYEKIKNTVEKNTVGKIKALVNWNTGELLDAWEINEISKD
jgi:hypothetical protein